MGFWSTFGKIALPAIGVAATPFTGGGSLLTTLGLGAKTAGLIGAGANVAGRLASGASKQRAEDRGAQADYNLLRQQVENQRIGSANDDALAFAKDRRSADMDRIRQLGSVDMLSNMKAPTDPRAQKFPNSGQMSPEHLAMIRERAMKALESGSDVPTLQTSAPTPQMPQGTKADSILNALSMGSTVLGGLNEAGIFNRQPQVDPTQNAANDDRVNDIYGKIRFFGGN